MPDIREVLNALDPQDRVLWSQHRTEMRRSYMAAHNSVLGIAAWDAHDDAFIDLIDIKLALLFDKSGRMDKGGKEVVAKADAEKVEETIIAQSEASKATQMMQNPLNSALVKPVSNGGWGDIK